MSTTHSVFPYRCSTTDVGNNSHTKKASLGKHIAFQFMMDARMLELLQAVHRSDSTGGEYRSLGNRRASRISSDIAGRSGEKLMPRKRSTMVSLASVAVMRNLREISPTCSCAAERLLANLTFPAGGCVWLPLRESETWTARDHFVGLVFSLQAVPFSSKWYLRARESPNALHPFCRMFPPCCLWNRSSVCLTNDGPFSSFQGRSSRNSSFYASPRLHSCATIKIKRISIVI